MSVALPEKIVLKRQGLYTKWHLDAILLALERLIIKSSDAVLNEFFLTASALVTESSFQPQRNTVYQPVVSRSLDQKDKITTAWTDPRIGFWRTVFIYIENGHCSSISGIHCKKRLMPLPVK
ncbi:MAG: hypothetical protein WKF91_07790 [Segetibacter sp.]